MKSIALEHAYGISTQEAKAGALQDLGPPELCDETLPQEEGGWGKQGMYRAAAGIKHAAVSQQMSNSLFSVLVVETRALGMLGQQVC